MVFTNDGIADIILTALNGGTVKRPTHIAIGTDSTSATEEDSALGDEKVRRAITTTTTGSDTVTFSAILLSTQQNGETLREAGTFSADTGGTCSSRSTHSAITKNSSIEVEYEFTFKVTN